MTSSSFLLSRHSLRLRHSRSRHSLTSRARHLMAPAARFHASASGLPRSLLILIAITISLTTNDHRTRALANSACPMYEFEIVTLRSFSECATTVPDDVTLRMPAFISTTCFTLPRNSEVLAVWNATWQKIDFVCPKNAWATCSASISDTLPPSCVETLRQEFTTPGCYQEVRCHA